MSWLMTVLVLNRPGICRFRIISEHLSKSSYPPSPPLINAPILLVLLF